MRQKHGYFYRIKSQAFLATDSIDNLVKIDEGDTLIQQRKPGNFIIDNKDIDNCSRRNREGIECCMKIVRNLGHKREISRKDEKILNRYFMGHKKKQQKAAKLHQETIRIWIKGE